MKSLQLVPLFLLIFSQSLLAQQSIGGQVVDADSGEPLLGAHVYLMNNWRKGVITDLEGNFSLDLTEADWSDSLIISYVGFEELIIQIKESNLIRLNPIQAVGEVVTVTAKPLIAEEFKYMDIQKMDIYTNPAAKADPILAVNSLPSSTTTDESANISLRGSSPIETGVFFNNVPIYDAVRYSQLNGIGTFSIFNTDIIKNVTVFPGNPPLEFGNATSGVISMQTDDGILKESTNSMILSLASIGFSRQQKINEKNSLKLFTNWQPSGAIKGLNPEALEDIRSFSSNDIGVYWYGGDNGYSWKVLAYGLTEGYQFNFSHPSFMGTFDQKKTRTFLIGTLDKNIGSGVLTFSKGMSYSDGDFSYSNVAFNTQKKDLFLGLNYQLTQERFSLKTGANYDMREAAVAGNFHALGYALGTDHPTFELTESVTIEVPELFGYFKYFLSDQLTVGTGARANLPTDGIDSYLSRQVNLSYNQNKWSVILGTGVYNKNGLLENTGEPFFSETTQTSLDLKRTIKNFTMAVSLFDKRGNINAIDYMAQGSEIFIDYRLNPNLRSSLSLTLLDASSNQTGYLYDLSYFFRGDVSWNPAPLWTVETIWVARQGTLFSDVTSTRFDAELNVYEPFFDQEGRRLPYYLNVGMSINKVIQLSDEFGFIAFASINNVLNRKNLRTYDYNFDYTAFEPSVFSLRTVYMGVVVSF